LDILTLTNKKQTEDDKSLQQSLAEDGRIPRHIAVIMDGNGRWAKSRGNIRLFGHKAGVDSVRDITEACAQLGVEYLTLYAFSTENWGRPMDEVTGLMQLLVQSLRSETKKLNDNDIRLLTIGQLERFPDSCQRELKEAINLTCNNKRMNLCLALSYSGRWDITQAVKKLAYQVREGKINPEDISDELISSELVTADIPDPDLIIRTSGEFRISNFLLWQLAYSELYITDTYWPDFRRNELYGAIRSYQKRERRFGKTSEQLPT
jgi:undecaprenyl diphosphate synthase